MLVVATLVALVLVGFGFRISGLGAEGLSEDEFLILSPTILLPETWRQMGLFASEKRIGRDGYEFMVRLYPHRWH